MTLSYDDFLKAQREGSGVLQITPLVESPKLSALIEGKVYLKYENVQVTQSFKARGAYTKLLSLSDADKTQGIVVVSAGNYGKAIAYFAQKMNILVHVVMPFGTDAVKADACQEYGASIEYKGKTLDEALIEGTALAQKQKKILVSPYDDDENMKGYGGIGIELIEQKKPPLDALIMPMGTGSMAAAIGRVLSVRWPVCALYGVQTFAAPTMAEKIFMYRTSQQRPNNTCAQECFVRNPTPEIVKNLSEVLNDVFVVTENAIHQAVHHCLRYERQIVEYSGALGIAALVCNAHAFMGKNVGIIICGGNTDFLEQIEIPALDID